ncbi:MAG: tetratricopeptide repeat protein [Armatimonadota bacterium]
MASRSSGRGLDYSVLAARVIIWLGVQLSQVLERFGPPERHLACRSFREQITDLKAWQREVAEVMETQGIEAGLDVLEGGCRRLGDEEMAAELASLRTQVEAIRAESAQLEAIRAETGDDAGAAVERYQEFLRHHPESSLAHSYLARALRQSGHPTEAVVAYRRAIELEISKSPVVPSHRIELGDTLLEAGDVEAAIAEYRGVISETHRDCRPLAAYAYLRLGIALDHAGDRSGARKAWKRAAHLDDTGTVWERAEELLAGANRTA